MSEEIQLAVTLLLIGMITVFIILTLVVFGGKALIAIVNRFGSSPEKIITPQTSDDEEIPVAILSAVVEHITIGKGTITRIEKLE